MPCVYALTASSSSSAVRYVGVTKYDDPTKRLDTHIYRASSGSTLPVHQWIRKHMSSGDAIIFTVLAENLTWKDALSKERSEIARLRLLGHRLLNVTDGGEGSLGVKQSEATKAKRSNSSRGRVVSEETREKISKANKNKTRTQEAKDRMKDAKLGKRLTDEHKTRIGLSLTGRQVSDETRKKLSDSQKGKTLTDQHLANIRAGQQRRRAREKEEKDKKNV